MKLQNKFFNMILNGDKQFEVRINDEKRQKIKKGDLINFESEDGDIIIKQVINKYYYKSFDELFECWLPYDIVGVNDVNTAIDIYRSFPDYEEGEKMYGVVMFEL